MSCSARTPHAGGPSNGAPLDARPRTAALPAANRERARLAEAERAVPGRYRGATQAAVLRAGDHAAHQAASIPREVAGATAPLVTKQPIARAGRQGSPDGQTGQPASMPGIGDTGDAPGAQPDSGTQAPRAWPPWAWTLA
jgi:hypothetical protein